MPVPLPGASRIFIDSSVLFAAALSARGSARELITLGLSGFVELAVSEFVWTETRKNLELKGPVAVPFLAELRDSALFVVVEPSVHTVDEVAGIIERKDAPIVAGAIAAEARFLASYDRRHVLSQSSVIRERFRIRAETPEAIIRAIRE